MNNKDTKLIWESYTSTFNEGSDSFGYNQGKGKHWKEYRKKFEDDPGYQQLKQKMQAEYDKEKKAKDRKEKTKAVEEDSDEELRRVDPEGAAFMDAMDRFKQLILNGHHQEARDMTELFRVDFNTEWENAKPKLAEWLVLDGGLDGASASELLDRDVNDHGDIVGDEAPW